MLLPVNIHFYKQSPVCGLRTLKKLCTHRKLCAGRTTCNNVRTDEQLCICSQQYSEILQLFSCWMFLQTRVWLLRSHRTVSAWRGIKSAEMSWKGRIQLWVYHYSKIWKLQIHTAALNTLRFDKDRPTPILLVQPPSALMSFPLEGGAVFLVKLCSVLWKSRESRRFVSS